MHPLFRMVKVASALLVVLLAPAAWAQSSGFTVVAGGLGGKPGNAKGVVKADRDGHDAERSNQHVRQMRRGSRSQQAEHDHCRDTQVLA